MIGTCIQKCIHDSDNFVCTCSYVIKGEILSYAYIRSYIRSFPDNISGIGAYTSGISKCIGISVMMSNSFLLKLYSS